MQRRVVAGLVVVAIASNQLALSAARADAPWKRLELFKHVEADPNADYTVTEQTGPWMIMAASFAGEDAQQRARDLVYELRKRYKLPAYVHNKTFDYSEKVRGNGVDPYGNPKQMRYRRSYKETELAVLVGNYSTANDPAAQRDLAKLKDLSPSSMEAKRKDHSKGVQGGDGLDGSKRAADGRKKKDLAGQLWDDLKSTRDLAQNVSYKFGNKKRDKGPMRNAFVTTNPLLPPEFFVTRGVDRMVEDMNRGVKHGLLDCPGKFSVQVAMFKGNTIIDQKKIKDIESGKKTASSELAQAAERAHRVCMALRRKGYEAYEFHDRYCSIVTIGSFDSVGTPRPDGKIEINPTIHTLMKSFAAEDASEATKKQLTGMAGATTGAIARRPQFVDGIALDLQPLPVTVPEALVCVEFWKPVE